MFEIATGKCPNLPTFLDGEEVGIVKWARKMLVQNKHMQMVGASISREGGLIKGHECVLVRYEEKGQLWLSTSSGPDEPIPCMDSCCKNKTINVLSKQEEFLLDLIEQIEDLVIKVQKLSDFKRTFVKETSKPEPKFQEPKVDLEKMYNRFTKSKKEVTVNDLQKEINKTKSKVRTLKQELTILRVDHNFLDQRLKHLENSSHQSNKEGPSFQNPSDDEDNEIVRCIRASRAISILALKYGEKNKSPKQTTREFGWWKKESIKRYLSISRCY
ncbi:hypothetical protein CFP56_022805 [Quercus suber]|uniref:Uncharacterized protein n=1 Tax=Quercus suber TaxID=58331 RepID=A0AAW0KAT4_QUESU